MGNKTLEDDKWRSQMDLRSFRGNIRIQVVGCKILNIPLVFEGMNE